MLAEPHGNIIRMAVTRLMTKHANRLPKLTLTSKSNPET
jgi:hypothetical protein